MKYLQKAEFKMRRSLQWRPTKKPAVASFVARPEPIIPLHIDIGKKEEIQDCADRDQLRSKAMGAIAIRKNNSWDPYWVLHLH
jgi:hypothetical protein